MTTHRTAFTLIELLVVISIIAALMAMTVLGIGAFTSRDRVDRTQGVINSLASAMASYSGGQTALQVGGQARSLWDVDGDGFLDGRPSDDPAFTASLRNQVAAVGYRGPASHLDVPDRHRDPATGQPIDAWGKPLRLITAGMTYRSNELSGDMLGGSMIGLVSDGPDEAYETDDDITSWGGETQ